MIAFTRTVRASLAALALAGALSATAYAGTTDRFDDSFVIEKTYSCGVMERTEVTLLGTAHLTSEGTWIRTLFRVDIDGTLTDPATGAQIDLKARQLVREEPGKATLTGQGGFVRVPGSGVVVHDVGRLVVALADGSTVFASAKVIGFDDPDAADAADAAICAMFD